MGSGVYFLAFSLLGVDITSISWSSFLYLFLWHLARISTIFHYQQYTVDGSYRDDRNKKVQSILEYRNQFDEEGDDDVDDIYQEGEDDEYNDDVVDELAEHEFKEYLNSEAGRHMLMLEVEKLRSAYYKERRVHVDSDVSSDRTVHKRQSFKTAPANVTLGFSSLKLVNDVISHVGSAILMLYPGAFRILSLRFAIVCVHFN